MLRRLTSHPALRLTAGVLAVVLAFWSGPAQALGSTRGLTNSNQAVTDTLETDAWGLTVSSTGSTPSPFGFVGGQGYQTDPDSGLMLLGARYYDPSLGRFLSRDPLRYGGGDVNLYRYCGNDPVNAADPSGQIAVADDLAILAVVLIFVTVTVIAHPGSRDGIGQVISDFGQAGFRAGWRVGCRAVVSGRPVGSAPLPGFRVPARPGRVRTPRCCPCVNRGGPGVPRYNRGMNTPLDRSYWIEPNRLLGGALPSHPDRALRRARVQPLLDVGVRAFVNLMEPGETNHYGQPFAPYEPDVRELAAAAGQDVATLRFPIPDMHVPTEDEMQRILDAIDAHLSNGLVFVHCWGGVGRTGTVACCWLLRHGRATAETVFDTLSELRQADTIAGGRPAPEAASQREFVRRWAVNPR